MEVENTLIQPQQSIVSSLSDSNSGIGSSANSDNGHGSNTSIRRKKLRVKRVKISAVSDDESDSDDNMSSSSGDFELESDDDDDNDDYNLSSSASPLSTNQHQQQEQVLQQQLNNDIKNTIGSFVMSDNESDTLLMSPQSISSSNSGGGGGSNNGASGRSSDEEVPLLSLFQKFLDREAIKKLQTRYDQLNKRLDKLKKVVDPKTLRDKGASLKKEKEKIKELIKLKKTQINDHMNAPPFLRTMDKMAFTFGLMVLCISEFVLFKAPQNMYLWYTLLIFPLMAIRFIMYHRAKYHYFMLDFCYLCQVLLLFYLFGSQIILGQERTAPLFKLVFALSNGPLAWGTVVWRNSLVFHDVDKLTSVFIHLCPPIVTFCLRWYPDQYTQELACGGSECAMTFKEVYVVPILLYIFWQVFYYLKTEIVDEVKLANDKDIMTSSRWMSTKQPHPLYKFFLRRGINISPMLLLMATQMVYTIGTLITLPFLMNSFYLHLVFLIFIFAAVSWNGSCYYFEVFSESYHKRFKSDMTNGLTPPNHYKLKMTSIYAFFKFLFVFLVGLLGWLWVIL